jgi:hypothetical protein
MTSSQSRSEYLSKVFFLYANNSPNLNAPQKPSKHPAQTLGLDPLEILSLCKPRLILSSFPKSSRESRFPFGSLHLTFSCSIPFNRNFSNSFPPPPYCISPQIFRKQVRVHKYAFTVTAFKFFSRLHQQMNRA